LSFLFYNIRNIFQGQGKNIFFQRISFVTRIDDKALPAIKITVTVPKSFSGLRAQRVFNFDCYRREIFFLLTLYIESLPFNLHGL